LPIKDNIIAKEISNYLFIIIEITVHCNINLINFKADGAITKIKAQQIVMKYLSASRILEFKTPLYRINFKAPIFNN
jgi:hypothetical protein